MDGIPMYTTNFASAPKDGGKVDYKVVSALELGSPCVSGYCVSRGSKRKCSVVDQHINLNAGSSLVFGLGKSSNSYTTLCPGKETEEESSIDLGLSINLNVGDYSSSNPKFIEPLKPAKVIRPSLDLQLSLSTGTAESYVTTANQALTCYQNYTTPPLFAPKVHLVNEGSISSRWRTGPLVPPSKSQLELSVPLEQHHGFHNPNPATPIISPTSVLAPSSDGSPSELVNKRQQRKTSMKTCRFGGCTRGARGASGLCIAHGGGRRCQRAGCHKGAEGKTVFCKAHGGGRRCHYLGCTKSAEGRTDFCIGHGGGRRCKHEGCTRASRGKSGLCIRHGGGKRCKMENCSKSAEGISGFCISHGGGRRCQYPECPKGAQGSTMFCKAHGGGRRCTFLGCTKGAEGSTMFCKGHGGGKRCTSEGCPKSVHGGTLFCVSHGGGKRCAVPECTKSARGRTSYCVRHGGGKRCKFEGCSKCAQGSTDYCKAHGGGKRCDKISRGKSDLCAAHCLQKDIHGSFDFVSTAHGNNCSIPRQMNSIFAAGNDRTSNASVGYDHQLISLPFAANGSFVVGNACLDPLSLPEGRVHGGGLMAMFRGGALLGMHSDSTREDGSQLKLGKSFHLSQVV